MDKILHGIETNYLTTDLLLDKFKHFKHPRDKLKNLVKSHDLINIKQGLYLLGEDYQRKYSKEVLAGMIYGPSAISGEYALSYWNYIPERVEVITSICFKRNKSFKTKIGLFTYQYLAAKNFSTGLIYEQTELGNFFIASPEKALCDLIYHQKIKDEEEAHEYLLDDLRISEDNILNLNLNLLFEIEKKYNKLSVKNMALAVAILQSKQRGNKK